METTCGIPNGVRYNNRYRGPHESKKVDHMQMQIKYNLTKLKARVAELDIYKDNMTVKPDYTNTNVLEKIEDIEVTLDNIREAIRYEQRNH